MPLEIKATVLTYSAMGEIELLPFNSQRRFFAILHGSVMSFGLGLAGVSTDAIEDTSWQSPVYFKYCDWGPLVFGPINLYASVAFPLTVYELIETG